MVFTWQGLSTERMTTRQPTMANVEYLWWSRVGQVRCNTVISSKRPHVLGAKEGNTPPWKVCTRGPSSRPWRIFIHITRSKCPTKRNKFASMCSGYEGEIRRILEHTAEHALTHLPWLSYAKRIISAGLKSRQPSVIATLKAAVSRRS